MEFHIPPLFVILLAGVLAPMLGEFTSRFGLPVIVLEILLGIILGPEVLGWAHVDAGAIPYLSLFGMGFLFFLAGLEIDLVAMRDKFLRVLFSWFGMLAIAYGCAVYFRGHGITDATLVMTIAIATTALGILVPILRDRDMLDGPLGQHTMALGAMGEVAPILVMSLALSRQHTAPVQTAFTVAFIALVIMVGWAMMHARTPKILMVLQRTMTQSSQLPIRMSVLLMVGMAVVADSMGLDLALGAMAAGMLVALSLRNSDSHTFHLKVDAVGFGFLVPIFFITSGMKLEIGPLFESSRGWALIGAFCVAILLARLPIMILYFRELGFRQSLALSLFSATTLSLIVALTEVGVASGLLTRLEAAPMVIAGMLTVIVFPAIATAISGAPKPHKTSSFDLRDGL